MKLAEALLHRSHLTKRIAELKTRAERCASVQEGTVPFEDPLALLDQLDAATTELESLTTRINTVNLTAILPDGTSLTAALAARDALVTRVAALHAVAESAVKVPDLYSAREVRWTATVNVGDLRHRRDELAKNLRTLNVAIQAANWAADC